MEDKKRQAKRYRLHFRIRKQGFLLNTKERTIYVCIDKKAISKQVKILDKEFNYSIQLKFD